MSAPSLLRSSTNVPSRNTRAVFHGLRAARAASTVAHQPPSSPSAAPVSKSIPTLQPFLQVQSQRGLSPIWFNATPPRFELPNPTGLDPKPDERKVKLGKTLRILQERLPNLLQSPLPQEILSPSISLHLFPSTHPHLPTVSGRVAYKAALWTSPIAWNRVPIVHDMKLQILSERMVSEPLSTSPRRAGACGEQLVVRWRSIGKVKSWGLLNGNVSGGQNSDPVLRGNQQPGEGKEFTGLFIFEFDKEGKILSHTIEHVHEDQDWEKGVGAKFVGLTDWLLGGIKGRGGEGSDGPCPAFQTFRDEKK